MVCSCNGSRGWTARLRSVNERLADIDGITSDGCGGYLITTLGDEEPWWIDASGQVHASGLGPIAGIDLHRRGGLLALPRVGGSLSVYDMSVY